MPQAAAKIFDCFLFSGELDVLEHRLRTLSGVVTTFVLVEATTTFQGRPKPVYFVEQRERFSRWLGQVRHVVAELAEAESPWDREREQHRAFATNLFDADPDDLVLVGDCDEIPFVDVVRKLASGVWPPTRLHMRNAVYWANTVRSESWTDGTMAFRWKDRDHAALAMLLGRPEAVWGRVPDPASIDEGGWHFGDLGGISWIARKLASFSHTELSAPSFSAAVHLERCRSLGVDYRSSEMLELLTPARLPPDVKAVEQILPSAIRRDGFPPRLARALYAAFSASRRRLPPGLVAWADRHIVLFLALFGLPIYAARRGRSPLRRAAKAFLRPAASRGASA